MLNDSEKLMFRQVMNRVFQVWHPALYMSLLQFALFFSLYHFSDRPVIDWMASKGYTVFTADFWQVAFFACAVTLTWRPPLKIVLACSLPGAVFAGFSIWYGLDTGALSATTMVMLAAALGGILGVMFISAFAGHVLAENALLRQQIAEQHPAQPVTPEAVSGVRE